MPGLLTISWLRSKFSKLRRESYGEYLAPEKSKELAHKNFRGNSSDAINLSAGSIEENVSSEGCMSIEVPLIAFVVDIFVPPRWVYY